MAQLSLPYRIALGAVLVLGVLWLLVLRPGGDDTSSEPLPQAPGVQGLSTAVDSATQAAGQANADAAAAGAKADAAAGDSTAASVPTTAPNGTTATAAQTTPAPGAPAPEVPAGDPSGPILRQVARGKVALVLFTRPGAADDELVRTELERVRRHGIVRRVVDIEDVAKYPALTVGVKISQAPTLLVIGRDRTARTIVGLTDRREITQAIGDARR